MVIMLYIGWNWRNWVWFIDYRIMGLDWEGMDMAELGRRRAIERRVMGLLGWIGIGLGRRVRVSYRYREGF